MKRRKYKLWTLNPKAKIPKTTKWRMKKQNASNVTTQNCSSPELSIDVEPNREQYVASFSHLELTDIELWTLKIY